MPDGGLTIASMFEYGAREFPGVEIASYLDATPVTHTYADVHARAAQLAHALAALGVKSGDRVATLGFNHHAHLEAYFAVPAMGAVIHTLNLRLAPEQLVWIANHAGDKVVIVDGIIAGALAAVIDQCTTLEKVIVVGPVDEATRAALAAARESFDYEELLRGQATTYEWPAVAEQDAAMICYTSGTTGDPKGVVYSHRSCYLHALGTVVLSQRRFFEIVESRGDVSLVVVPMFHASAWGIPYAGWMAGVQLVLPGRFLQAKPLAEMFARHGVTMSAGVPTIWNDMYHYLKEHPQDMSKVRLLLAGGSATPRSLIQSYLDDFGVPLISGWGMTETSPVCTLAVPPVGTPRDRLADYMETAGKAVPGVDVRIIADDGSEAPRDGKAIGELQVRGPWVTVGYLGIDAPASFDGEWLRTGDIATIDPEGYVRIVDRSKDVVKSGGEWISSIELENVIMGHPKVLEAAVIGVPDPRWFERPLAVVVPKPGETVTVEELRAYLEGKVAKWWIPERFSFVAEIPRTSVGKFHKRGLREQHEKGVLQVVEVRRGEE